MVCRLSGRPAHMSDTPFDRYQPTSIKLAGVPRDARTDLPLRAKSVCLAERPRSKYERAVRSADPKRLRFPERTFIHHRQPSTDNKRKQCANNVVVKQQNKKIVDKVPCSISIQNLSIPMKYADYPKSRHSTSKPTQNLCNNKQIDINKTKFRNPPKQVGDNKRLCQTAGCGKETENKLLLQIREAEQVSDFERILNTNAILCERAKRHVWRGCGAALKPSASVLPRPRSAYSLYAVSQAYHYLFRQHEESLQPLIDDYRQTTTEQQAACPPSSLLGNNWFDNLQDLSEFYEEDQALRKEVETITDRIIAAEVRASEDKTQSEKRNKNFKVNLAGLIGLHVNGEGCSPYCDDLGTSPEIDKEVKNEEEWLKPIMSSTSDDHLNTQHETNVECLTQNLDSVKLKSDDKVPTITFSDCSDGCVKNDLPDNTNLVIHLAVPPVDIINEARPPMM